MRIVLSAGNGHVREAVVHQLLALVRVGVDQYTLSSLALAAVIQKMQKNLVTPSVISSTSFLRAKLARVGLQSTMEHPPYDSGSHILARLKNQVQYREMLPVNTQPGLLKKSDES